MDAYDYLAQLHKVLAHPVRLRILDILSKQEACVCHLTAILGQRQPNVSQHLALLRAANLVTDRRDGTLIYYRLADDQLAALLASAKGLVHSLDGRSPAFPPIPTSPVEGCPCPHCQAG